MTGNRTLSNLIAVVLVAAGRGTRAGRPGPKQWEPLLEQRVADWTVQRFQSHPRIGQIVLVVHPDDLEHTHDFKDVTIAIGGATRALSVKSGLASVEPGTTRFVLIHDIARCTVSSRVIDGVLDALETSDAAAPALEVTDALWTGAEGIVTGTRERTGLFRAQTPQGFRLDKIIAAHEFASGDEADDVEIARAAGLQVAITLGDEENLKITSPQDFDRAATLLKRQQ